MIHVGPPFKRGERSEQRRTSPTCNFAGGAQADTAIRKSMRDVRIHYQRMGLPLVAWKNGKLNEVPPGEIQINDTPMIPQAILRSLALKRMPCAATCKPMGHDGLWELRQCAER
jgi:hypothetical protein